jgi:glycosyltransferase involved in cell wall biosynthesis
LGEISSSRLWRTYAHCRALLFAADEDFGMVSLEAQACGRPVVAYGKGGSLETVRGYPDRAGRRPVRESGATGMFFYSQTADAVAAAILRLEAVESEFSARAIQEHARRFDTCIFIEKIRQFVSEVLATSSQSTRTEPAAGSTVSEYPAELSSEMSF